VLCPYTYFSLGLGNAFTLTFEHQLALELSDSTEHIEKRHPATNGLGPDRLVASCGELLPESNTPAARIAFSRLPDQHQH
jgi:hypothetical protein